MLKVLDVKRSFERECWEWEGKRYPTLRVCCIIDDGERETFEDFAAYSLWKDMEKAYDEESDTTKKNDIGSMMGYIDRHIYAYVPDYLFEGYTEKQIGSFIERHFD